MSKPLSRELVIKATPKGFLVETIWYNGLGYGDVLSRTVTTTFPRHIVERVADRADYVIRIRSMVAL